MLHGLDRVAKPRKRLTAVGDVGFHHLQAVGEQGTTYPALTLTSVGRRELRWPDYVKGKKLYLKNEGQLNFGIQLHEGEVADGESVLPLLNRFKAVVLKTIDTIAEAYEPRERAV